MLRAYDETTGREIMKGDIIKDFRGDEYMYIGATRARTISKSGKVYVKNKYFIECYDKVFGLIVKDE